MIRYALVCRACAHRFDAWFGSGAGFETQASRNLLACPECGASAVEKALMAPRLRTEAASPPAEATRETTVPATPPPVKFPSAESPSAESPSVKSQLVKAPPATSAPGARQAVLRRVLHDMRHHAEAVGEDVGRRFASEARRIHEGEATDRPIRGQASGEEVKALHEDGIEVFALPEIEPDA